MTAPDGSIGDPRPSVPEPAPEEIAAPPPIAEPAFEIVRPARLTTPIVCASPHSGRLYPPEMMSASLLDAAAIRKSEDAFVDDLIAAAPRHGAPLIRACYARAYMDLNRGAYELDPAMFEDELPAYARGSTARVAAGLGSIPRVVGEGQEIYRRKLRFAEARGRIDTVHEPYHRALSALLSEAHAVFGLSILIDWHSMPSAATASGRGAGPDMVLGDRFGASCSPAIASAVEAYLRKLGYAVVRNAPYAGGHSTELHGRPGEHAHALQVEINRGLYLNERNLRPTSGFRLLAIDFDRLFETLASIDWRAIG